MKKIGCILLSSLIAASSAALIAGCSDKGKQNAVTIPECYHVAVEGGTGAGLYEADAVCLVQAVVPEGKQFMKWLKNGEEVSVNVSYSFNVTENSRLIAVFGDGVSGADAEVCYVTVTNGIGGGGYLKGSECTLKVPDTEMDRTFKGWVPVVKNEDGEWVKGEIISAVPLYKFTVESSVTFEATYSDERLPVPDNSDNQMFNLVAGQPNIMYDRQVSPDGERITAFVEGVSYIRIYVYTSPEDDAAPIGWFKMVQREDGSAYFESVDSGRTHNLNGTPGDYSTPDGNTHNWLKATIGEMSDGAYSTEKTYYFATQAIGKIVGDYTYLNSAISGKGRGVKNM